MTDRKQSPSGRESKRVSEPVYPADILGDLDIQRCSLATKGAWMWSLLEMWRCGRSEVSGSFEDFAHDWRCTPEAAENAINELETRDVTDVTKSNGIVTLECRRLKRREIARKNGAERVAKHRGNKGSNTPCNSEKGLPSSSSSSSSSISSSGEPPLTPPGGMNVTDDPVKKSPPKKKTIKKPTKEQLSRIKIDENTETMKRIGKWFGRKETSLWNIKEATALSELGEIDPEDLALLEAFYTADLAGDDFRRRALGTLLNNWSVDLDRARDWNAKKERKPVFA